MDWVVMAEDRQFEVTKLISELIPRFSKHFAVISVELASQKVVL